MSEAVVVDENYISVRIKYTICADYKILDVCFISSNS